jgi:peroxiredoxin
MIRRLAIIGLFVVAHAAAAQDSGAVKLRLSLEDAARVGRPAPAVVLPYATADSAGPATQPFDLSKELGRIVVLVFYPGDSTGTASGDWQAVVQHEQAALDAGVVVVGIAPDPVERHVAFAREHALPFKLLTDRGSLVSRRYGFGRGNRSRWAAVVIGRDGRVRYVDPQFAPGAGGSYVHMDAAIRAARERR